MKKNKKITICTILFLTIFLLTACNSTPSSRKDTESETAISCSEEKQALLNHWINYLEITETMYRQMHMVFDYTEKFAEDNNWNSLQKARSACSTIKENLKKLPALEFTLTDEQCKVLENAGIEVDVVLNEYLSMETEKNTLLDTLAALESILNNEVFFSSIYSDLDILIDNHRSLLIDASEYLCLTTNYLLLQLEETILWENIPNDYPCIAMGYSKWNTDSISLMENASLALDRYESQFMEFNELLGTTQYTLLLVEEALTTGNLEYLTNEMHTISEVPAYFPAPTWLSENSYYYYLITDSNTQEKRMVASKEDFEQIPSACLISSPSITREEVELYGESLKAWNETTVTKWIEESQTYEIFSTYGNSQMLISWTEAETSVYLTEPIACLIPELYLVALLNK